MDLRSILLQFFTTFVVVLVVAAVVTLVWSGLLHSHWMIDWESAVRLALILAIILTWQQSRDSTERSRESHHD